MSAPAFVFGELLKSYRVRAGILQHELADRIGVSRNTISAWERSLNTPGSKEDILNIETELSLSQRETDWLLYTAEFPLEYGTSISHESLNRNLRPTQRDDSAQKPPHVEYLADSAKASNDHEVRVSPLNGDILNQLLDQEMGDQILKLRLTEIIRSYQNLQENKNLTIIMMKISNLGIIKDVSGIEIGNTVLAIVATMLYEEVENREYLGRYGDDTFFAILLDYNIYETMGVVDRLLTRLDEYEWTNLHAQIRVMCSFGAAQWFRNESTIELVIRATSGISGGATSKLEQITENSDDLTRGRAIPAYHVRSNAPDNVVSPEKPNNELAIISPVILHRLLNMICTRKLVHAKC